TELKNSADAEPDWARLVVAGVVTPGDDRDSRIVYAYGWNETETEQSENRFWIAREGDAWKIYDWERLDLGLPESQEWGVYCKYAQTPVMENYHRWAELVSEADAESNQGNQESAKEKLRRAEAETVPPELADYHWLLTGYRWAGMGEHAEADRCYRNIQQPDESPGAYFSLMRSKQWTSPQEALQHAEQYEAVNGPSPDLLEIKAGMLQRLGRDAEAQDEWKKLLAIEPDDETALTEFYLALAPENKSAFEAQLERLEDPAAAAASIASRVGYRKYHDLVWLVDYLERTAPGKPGTKYVSGFAKQLNGEHDAAAALFREAYEAEGDEDKRDGYRTSLLEAMIADGRVIEAIHELADSKPTFESLAYQMDEGEVALTKEEERQIIELYAARFPESLDAVSRVASLAIDDKRYEDAVRVLRPALARMPAAEEETEATDSAGADKEDDDENKAYRSSLQNLLADALWKSGQHRAAYESAEDRKQTFAYLARLAVVEKRWDDARELVALHQANGADDPELRSLEGELLANEGRWDEAIGKFEEAFKTTPEDKRWLIQYRLPQSYLDAGKWADYYAAREEPREAFETLGDRFIENEDWKALAELVALHRTHAADDPRITKYEAELAWERQEYEEYVRRAAELLACTDENVVASYERPAIEHRRIRALLRSGRRNEAEELAREKQRKENDAALLAIVMAAAGDLVGAERLAREASESDESASSFYTDDEVGHLFLGPQFADLQEEFPVQLPYRASTTFAVFVSAEDWPLESAEVERAGRELGFAPLFPAAPVSAIGPNVERAFALRCDGGSVWVAVGKGKFDASWLADADQGAIAAGVNNSDAWLAVGAAAWTDAGREKIDPLARRLAVRLAAGRNAIVCAAAKNYWESFRAYEPSPELLEAWQSTGNLRPFRYDAVSLAADVEENNVAADRKFSRSLHEAVRAFEADPNRRFEVWANVSRRPALDPLRLRVRAVRRKYGSLEFDGTLESQSSLISELKPGLSMRLQEFELGAWRLDAADPVYRQP
ncbi:MAG: hypothetical protein AB7I57_24900, partial [Pirellulales bacterium]